MAANRVQNEDTLECFLYPKFCYSMETDSVSETILNEEINKYNEFINKFTNDYLWHHDSLVFHPRTKQAIVLNQMLHTSTVSQESSLVPHIYASLRFDEDVGDEWFTVFLIFKLTESFDGLIARLVDSDGEFLLIETANYLPRWAEPETCQDRVYIFDGRIHVVQDKRVPPIQQLKRISENSQNYLLSREAQETLKKRLAVYPDELKLRKHKARAFLPEKAASILAQNPGLIASAIRTIVHSDPLERKVCRAMRYFPPEQRTMVNVQMTKCLYAMSSHCRYTGDPRTGWNFPPTNSPKYNAHLLGIKIACGLEMLVARANEQLRRKESSESIDDNQWREYRHRLEASGYFRSTLEGSKERERLTQTAKEYLAAHPLNAIYVSTDNSAAMKILEAWKNVKTEDFEMHAQDEASLSPPDDDSWLNVDAAQLEDMLGQHWIHGNKKPPQEPLNLKDKVKVFLNQKSDVDGIEFSSGSRADDENKNDIEDVGRIDFDPEVFDSTLRDILDLVVPGGDGEFDGSSEGSLGGDEEDERGGEIDKYMKLMDAQLEAELAKDNDSMSSRFKDSVESNLMESIEEEAGGAGPAGNIIGGPVRRLMHLQLQSPTTVPPDLQS
ncbi:protein ecdysoneless [Microplitis demolitor]|uniref:protein ecdysoneless n=1 Tax=Microplitis demolitor TaxID=69319 RepID=UPI0004CCD6D0|nr:protein ecdysoneless [Microplitis demolitor]